LEPTTARRVLPAAIIGGSAAGALAAFFLVRWEVGRLRPKTRLEVIEEDDAPAAAAAPAVAEEISPEVLSVISAVVAAYFGKSARVTAVRPVRAAPSPWVQQGRVSVQGSHHLARQ
jgi:hypothetical protein